MNLFHRSNVAIGMCGYDDVDTLKRFEALRKLKIFLVFYSLNRIFDFAEDTHARKNSNIFGFSLTKSYLWLRRTYSVSAIKIFGFILYCSRLFVTLHTK